MFAHRSLTASLTLLLSLGLGQTGQAQADRPDEATRSTVAAPPGTRSFGSALGGEYFVDAELFKRYEAVKARLSQVRDDIALGRAGSEDALKSLADIEEQLKRLKLELDKAKVLVSAFMAYTKTSEQVFALGEERLVILTGDRVVLRGWEGPGIKCVVDKTILAKQEPPASAFDAIGVEHELAVAEQKVGLTRQQRDDQERKFLESEAGRKLNDEQKASRRKLVEEIHHSYDHFLAFQGRQANSIQLEGLTYDQGNRNLTMRINSDGGGAMMASQWQRHAKMTVYVPACKAVAVRGCQAGLDIQSVVGDLVLTTIGSRDRDYQGSFTIRGVQGNLTIYQVPVRMLSAVTGSVRFTATDEFVNSGTHHENGLRTFARYETQPTRIDNIGGDFQATFLRTSLALSGIRGVMDVVNAHGSTELTLSTADTERAHRIISESGKISVQGPKQVMERTPIYAHTRCGRLQTNLSRAVLDDVGFSTGRPRMGWHGFVTPSKERFGFSKLERPAAALEDRTRAAGLDLVSHAGTVAILSVNAP